MTVEFDNGFAKHAAIPFERLLLDNEAIVVVDDDPVFRDAIRIYLNQKGFRVLTAHHGNALLKILDAESVAMVLLDIGLPDISGTTLLPRIIEQVADVSVVMFTGLTDLQTAIECIRNGAEDYLAKPSNLPEIDFVVRKTLEKRRILIDSRRRKEDLEQANFRLQLLQELSVMMNTVYLSTIELDEILQAILVGITAGEGLGFNRAFLAMFNDDNATLEGRFAIGTNSREAAGQIWDEIKEKHIGFRGMVQRYQGACVDTDVEVNRIARSIMVPLDQHEHILVKAARERRSIRVTNGTAEVPTPSELIALLGEDTFVVVPLYSPSRSLGVIIADHFVTHQPITDELLGSLEQFASQASLAIEHSHLYMVMQRKIAELENLTDELDKNKDMLVEAERYSALGHMSAQMVHILRNPITKIGGGARVLARKNDDPQQRKFLDMMVREADRLESTMDDLFVIMQQDEPQKEATSLYPLIHKTVTLLQTMMTKRRVTAHLDLPEPDPLLRLDQRQIRQVLLNLMKNGIEAMEDGGCLSVVVARQPDAVRITISDTGAGMNIGTIDRATVPFFTTKTYGTGMGLTLVEQIVKAHEGSLVLQPRGAAGMDVSVTLPLDDGS